VFLCQTIGSQASLQDIATMVILEITSMKPSFYIFATTCKIHMRVVFIQTTMRGTSIESMVFQETGLVMVETWSIQVNAPSYKVTPGLQSPNPTRKRFSRFRLCAISFTGMHRRLSLSPTVFQSQTELRRWTKWPQTILQPRRRCR
jgi:hypothetical protein